MNITINVQALEEKLKAEYLGKQVGYGASEVRWAAYRHIQEELKAQNLSEAELRNFNVVDQRKSFNQSITYRGHIIGEVMIKRTKANKHYSYFGDYCDYTYKDIHVELDDLATRLDEINKYEQSLVDAKVLNLQKAKDAFKLIKDTFNMNDSQARDLISNIYNNRYSLGD